jgi:hypothetical protein
LRRGRTLLQGLIAPALLLGLSCSTPSPEEQVRELIERAEAAARDRDVGELSDMLSERYRDAAGNGKQQALAILRYQFLQHQSLHLLKRVRTIQSTEPGIVEAVLLVAAADVEFRSVNELESVSAELLRFDLVFAEEDGGDWRVLEAEWRSVGPADFL